MRRNNKIAFLIACATISTQIISTGFIANAQAPKNTSTTVINTQENYPNEVTLSGVWYSPGPQSFKLKFDREKQKLIATDLRFPNNAMHTGFADTYIKLELIGKNGKVKDTFSMNGTDKVDKVNEINAPDKFKFEYGDYLKIYHREAGWRTKISGTVQDASLGTNYKEEVSGDILSKYVFKITETGLQQVKESSLKESKLYKNELLLSGIGYAPGPQSFKLKFDTKNEKLIATDLRFPNNMMHAYFGGTYIKLQLFDKNGKLKDTFNMNGTDKVDVAKKINDANRFNFDYGDYLKVYHREADWRTKIFGDVQDASSTNFNQRVSGDVLNSCVFKITEDGLKQVKVYKNEIELLGLGYGSGYQSFRLKFDTENKRILATDLSFPGNMMHSYFGDTYIRLTLIGQNGKTKAEFSINGTDKIDKVKQINDKFNFEYGDKLKIYHREAYGYPWRTKISGGVQDNHTGEDFTRSISGNVLNNYEFEITPNGLKLVHN